MGASHDSKLAVSGGDGSSSAQHLPITNRLRSGSVHLPMNPGVLRRHHLLLTIVTLVLTLALLLQALTPHRCASPARPVARVTLRFHSLLVAETSMYRGTACASRVQIEELECAPCPLQGRLADSCSLLDLNLKLPDIRAKPGRDPGGRSEAGLGAARSLPPSRFLLDS